MRTTLDIDDDVIQAARERARHDGKTMGRVISELARHALSAGPPEKSSVREPEPLYGFRPFAKRGGIVTNDAIDRLRDDDLY
jgi:Bacterial antitoxin of type II TA system, VapB